MFLGYSVLHKEFKCLDVPSGRVYISRDVTFDEKVFPFSTLHPNAGSQLCSEILLLSPDSMANSGDNRLGDQLTDLPCTSSEFF